MSDYCNSVLEEFLVMHKGALIGEGMSRKVYKHKLDPTKVIKIEDSTNHFQNVMEWEIWNAFKYVDNVSKWLAPCHYISYSGTFLIQEYCHDARPEEIPALLPTFLSDHKPGNYGIYNGNFVCRDYGLLTLNPSLRMRKWYGAK